ncbi:MAG: DEAD/DEAH box helicase, partial [Planctomycetota bacterium]
MTTFSSLGLSAPLLKAVTSRGYTNPTDIQAAAIPSLLNGRDLMGCAQTGTGKTAAFALPLLDLLAGNPGASPKKGRHGARRPRALVLSPTRELAGQIEESFRAYGTHTGLRHTVIFGGVKQWGQVRDLRAGVDIIVATPGRLLDLFEQGHVDLGAVEFFVLDEADRMLDMGFIQPIRTIAASLQKNRQTAMFSATMPANIKQLADSLLKNPEHIVTAPVDSAAPSIDQCVFMVGAADKPAMLGHMLRGQDVERSIVFTRTKHGADKLTKFLREDGVRAVAIHGNRSQMQRTRALDAFRSGKCPVLIATDVAARGLDVDGVTHVFNFSLPDDPESYVHRIGRTGRAGATGIAITFCSRGERGILRTIERIIDERIDRVRAPEEWGIENEHEAKQADRPKNRVTSRPASRPTSGSVPRSKGAAQRKPAHRGRGSDRAGAGAGNAFRGPRSGSGDARTDRTPAGSGDGNSRGRSNKARGHRKGQRTDTRAAANESSGRGGAAPASGQKKNRAGGARSATNRG